MKYGEGNGRITSNLHKFAANTVKKCIPHVALCIVERQPNLYDETDTYQ